MELRAFFSGIANVPLWWRLAWADMNQIYRRSLVGIFWISISFLMFVGVKIFIFGAISQMDMTYYSLWVIIGYAVWNFLNASVTDSCTVFIGSRSWILGTNMSLGTFVAQSIMRHIISLFFVGLISIAAVFFYSWEQSLVTFTVLIGLIFLIINSMWVHIVLGALCARHRDILHLVQAVMHVMFFLTPILYIPKQLGPKAAVLNYNPFTHYLAIVREPVVNGIIPQLSWTVVICITIVGWIAALYTLKYKTRNIAFWI